MVRIHSHDKKKGIGALDGVRLTYETLMNLQDFHLIPFTD